MGLKQEAEPALTGRSDTGIPILPAVRPANLRDLGVTHTSSTDLSVLGIHEEPSLGKRMAQHNGFYAIGSGGDDINRSAHQLLQTPNVFTRVFRQRI